MKDNPVTMVQD